SAASAATTLWPVVREPTPSSPAQRTTFSTAEPTPPTTATVRPGSTQPTTARSPQAYRRNSTPLRRSVGTPERRGPSKELDLASCRSPARDVGRSALETPWKRPAETRRKTRQEKSR